jgi:hypothetical protein
MIASRAGFAAHPTLPEGRSVDQLPGKLLRKARFIVVVLLLAVGVQVFAQGDVIRRHYVWEYGGTSWSFTYDFPSSIYSMQKSLPRTLNYQAYSTYVNDPRDDTVLGDFLRRLEATAPNLDVWDRLNWVIALIQSIPYASETCEYPRYPLETLVDQQGDCEDMAILAAGLLQQMGFGVVLLAYLEEHHMAVGIRVLPPGYEKLQAYEWQGDLYFYLEPTNVGWAIGQTPSADMSQPVIVGLGSILAAKRP